MKKNLGPLEITKAGWWASSGGLQALRVGLSPRDQLHRALAVIKNVHLKEPCSQYIVPDDKLISES